MEKVIQDNGGYSVYDWYDGAVHGIKLDSKSTIRISKKEESYVYFVAEAINPLMSLVDG